MQTVRDIATWQRARKRADFANCTVGFVPTMGALHEGHTTLIERARRENDRVVVSIFVNPTQFNDPKDLEEYPRTWAEDLVRAEEAGADWVFAPPAEEMYPDQARFRVSESGLSNILEGAQRPGHFEGVLTVVMKLLQLVRPDRAYFGEKDLQQLLLIRDTAEAFFLPVEIIGCPTVRAPDGLALSSRNALLTPPARAKAATFAQVLQTVTEPAAARQQLTDAGFEVDYIENHEQWRLGAVRLEGIRLIDNVRRDEVALRANGGTTSASSAARTEPD